MNIKYDAGKIIPGLIIFVLFMTFPIWYNMGNAGTIPNPEKPANGARQCVAETKFMRTDHMVLLNDWRDEVIREGKRQKIEIDGVHYEKSLQNGCMHCHANKEKFCDTCHTYASVKPYCWDCHFNFGETLKGEKL